MERFITQAPEGTVPRMARIVTRPNPSDRQMKNRLYYKQ